jgi:hypothetical protein
MGLDDVSARIICRSLVGEDFLQKLRHNSGKIACALLLAGAALAAERAIVQPAVGHLAQKPSGQVFYNGKLVRFQIETPGVGERKLVVGPWQMGPKIPAGKPSDHRPNLYFVSPGKQDHVEGWNDYDHNEIISGIPKDQPTNWDVYLAIVLDPALQKDFQNESELLTEAQQSFRPNDLFEFEDIPGAGFLRSFLKIDSVHGLDRFRHKNGQLPRLVIVPSGFVVRATAVDPNPAGNP